MGQAAIGSSEAMFIKVALGRFILDADENFNKLKKETIDEQKQDSKEWQTRTNF